jgi:phospholipid transport system transporter-binding protein
MSTLQLPPNATLDEACSLLATLVPGTQVVDASGLKTFDTSVIALLLQARRMAEARGEPFAVAGAPPKLLELAQLYGVDELLFTPVLPSATGAASA